VALVRYLPGDAAVVRAEGAWSPEASFLVAIVEELDALLRLTFQTSAGKRAPWKPVQIPRPRSEDEPAGRREASPEELLGLLGVRGGLPNGR
jgi:hypothetical protein